VLDGSYPPVVRLLSRLGVALVVAGLLAGCGQVGTPNDGSARTAARVWPADDGGGKLAFPRPLPGGHTTKPILTTVTVTKVTTFTRAGTAGAASSFVPPLNASQAQIAVDAAASQLGVPYVYAAADPGHAFDCSGLTMWVWREAGVSLPHNAAAQYAALPHVPVSALEPGDLVFFYRPIEHVGIYIGGGLMIDAPRTGASVERAAVPWQIFAGAARP